jgi:ubiquitin-protein ligase
VDAQAVRRVADLERLRALTGASGGKISVFDDQARAGRYVIDLRYMTVGSRDYPRVKQPVTRVVLELGARYPFQPPIASIVSPIFHPNVFASGVVCLGAKWLPSEGMDLFVQRIARLITFDPLLVNVHSAANAEAMHWYARAVRAHPAAFPTDKVELAIEPPSKSGVKWQSPDDRVLVPCPQCATQLRLPAGKHGTVKCPQCAQSFTAQT